MLTENEVPPGDLSVQNLLLQGLGSDVGLGKDPLIVQSLRNLRSVVLLQSPKQRSDQSQYPLSFANRDVCTYVNGSDRNYDNLPGGQPEWPVSSTVFSQDSDEPLDRSDKSSVDHDGSRIYSILGILSLVRSSVLQVESFWQVEVELRNGRSSVPFLV
jgi:hypothetical protein